MDGEVQSYHKTSRLILVTNMHIPQESRTWRKVATSYTNYNISWKLTSLLEIDEHM
jgi:hypothetical protein